MEEIGRDRNNLKIMSGENPACRAAKEISRRVQVVVMRTPLLAPQVRHQ